MTRVLFICKYNRFRSKVAEAIFNRLNRNHSNSARSAGVIRGSPISPAIFKAAKKAGYPIKGKPQGLSTELLKWHDTAIIVADDVPRSLFKDNEKYGHKTIFWNIPDTSSDKIGNMQKTILAIEKKVRAFLKNNS